VSLVPSFRGVIPLSPFSNRAMGFAAFSALPPSPSLQLISPDYHSIRVIVLSQKHLLLLFPLFFPGFTLCGGVPKLYVRCVLYMVFTSSGLDICIPFVSPPWPALFYKFGSECLFLSLYPRLWLLFRLTFSLALTPAYVKKVIALPLDHTLFRSLSFCLFAVLYETFFSRVLQVSTFLDHHNQDRFELLPEFFLPPKILPKKNFFFFFFFVDRPPKPFPLLFFFSPFVLPFFFVPIVPSLFVPFCSFSYFLFLAKLFLIR